MLVRRRRVRAVVLHDRRVALAVRAAVAGGRLRDDRVVPALELARAGAVGLAARTRGTRRKRPAARGRLGRSAARLASARLLQRLAPARWLLVAAYVVVTVGDRRRRRPDARARDLSRGRRQPVPAALPRAGRHEVRVDRAAGDATCSTRSSRRPARTTSRSRSATSASSPRRIRSTPSFCGPAARTKACCRWRSSRRRGIRLDGLRGSAAPALPRAVSRRAVLVRAGRHRQPDHELRRADAGRGRGRRARTSPPAATFAAKVRDELARIPVAARSAVRPGARLPGDPGRRRTARWPASSASPSTRSAARSPPPPRRAASSRRTTGPTRAPASRSRCRSRSRSRG